MKREDMIRRAREEGGEEEVRNVMAAMDMTDLIDKRFTDLIRNAIENDIPEDDTAIYSMGGILDALCRAVARVGATLQAMTDNDDEQTLAMLKKGIALNYEQLKKHEHGECSCQRDDEDEDVRIPDGLAELLAKAAKRGGEAKGGGNAQQG